MCIKNWFYEVLCVVPKKELDALKIKSDELWMDRTKIMLFLKGMDRQLFIDEVAKQNIDLERPPHWVYEVYNSDRFNSMFMEMNEIDSIPENLFSLKDKVAKNEKSI